MNLIRGECWPLPVESGAEFEERLRRHGKVALQPLAAAANCEDVEVRARFVAAFRHIKHPLVVELLMDKLADHEPQVRKNAAFALGEIGDPQAAQRLLQAVATDQDTMVRVSAVRAIARMKYDGTVVPLISVLKDRKVSPELRGSVARALGSMKRPEAPELLLEIIRDQAEHAHVRADALCGVGAFGDAELVPLLLEVLRDQREDAKVRGAAARALAYFKNEDTVSAFIEVLSDNSFLHRANVARALGWMGSARAVEPLTRLLADKDWIVRACACKSLGRLKASVATNALIRVSQDDPDLTVRGEAITALMTITGLTLEETIALSQGKRPREAEGSGRDW